MKFLAILSGLLLASAAEAEVSFRYVGTGGTVDGRTLMSDDARIISVGTKTWRDFQPEVFAQQYPPYGHFIGVTGVSGDGNVLTAYSQVSQFQWHDLVMDGQPWAATQQPLLPADECGDGVWVRRETWPNYDGSVLVRSARYRGDLECGYVSDGRERADIWRRGDVASQLLFVPSQLADIPTGVDGSRYRIFALDVSSDGTAVAGYTCDPYGGNSRLYRWTTTGGPVRVFTNDGFGQIATAMSKDANTIVGFVRLVPQGDPGSPALAAWTVGQPMRRLDLEPGASAFPAKQALVVSNSAGVIGGFGGPTSGPPEAIIWTATGVHRVRDLLPASAASEWCGFQFQSVNGISPDGRIIAGFGKTSAGVDSVWVASLTGAPLPFAPPLRVIGDTNNDTHVNGADLSALLSSFGTTVTPGATPDLNCDGFINAADLSVLLGAFGT